MWIVIIALVIVIFVLLMTPRRPSTNDDHVRILYRQAARYAVAASQDDAPAIAVLHANYGMGYLLALRDLVTNEEFKRITGTSLLDFEQRIARIQDAVTLRLVERCEALIPEGDPTLLRAMYI